ncbi:MAG: restriction endonuclease subunit S [Pseudomonadota bacterium]|nr:restriction endonuclease subunit S [Pseudomonadota bacterium]
MKANHADGWTTKTLSDLATINMGQSPDSTTYNELGIGLPFLQGCGDFGKNHPETNSYCSSPSKQSKVGNILISVRAPVGDMNTSDKEYCIGRGLAAIAGTQIESSYLRYSIEQHITWLKRRGQGSTFEAIGSRDLNDFPVPIPKSSEVRNKITSILTTVDNLIDQTQNLIDKYTAVKQGMMADLFSRGIDLSGTPQSNKNYGQLRPSYEDAPELYQETKLGWIPKDWEIANLGEVADVIDPQPDHRTPPESENGIPYVGVGDFYWDQRIDRERCRKVIEAAYDKQRGRFQVELGDSIFGKIGTIGQPKQLKETEGFALSANILLIKAKEKNDYVFSFFDSVFFNKQLSNIINTTSQPALGIQTMRDILVVYPKCEKELHGITEKLKAINDSIVAYRKELHKYELIKKGLMQDLLTGKVKV